jgi:TetR/AcrR family transcriptional regulator, tetracycline repressor protein
MNLDRQTVVRAALRLLDEVGLDGLTVRKLARELGVQAPALYWHFKNKQELLDEMATAVFADAIRESGLPSKDATWSDWAVEYGKRLRQMLLRYRDGARMFSGRYLTDSALFEAMEISLRKLTDAGFSLHDATQGLNTIYCYAVGFTIEEQAVYPRPGKRSKRYDLAKRAKRIDSKRFPLAVAAGKHAFLDFNERFEQGLQLIIRGLRPTGVSDVGGRDR